MRPNKTRFSLILETNAAGSKWLVVDPVTDKSVAWSATYEGALTAAEQIEKSGLTPVADAQVAVRSFRETLRVGHLGKVLAERLRRQATL